MSLRKKNCSVSAIIFDNNIKNVLVIKRRDVPLWVLPGGGVEPQEKPEEAIIREVFEETGLEVSIIRKVGIYTPINRLSSVTQIFECRKNKGKIRTGEETKEIGFFPIEALPKPFFPLHADMIKDALMKHPQVLRKPLTQVTYWKLLIYFLRHPIQVIRFVLSKLGLPINS